MITINIAFFVSLLMGVALLMAFLGLVYGYVVAKRVVQKWFVEQGYVLPVECYACKFHDQCIIEMDLKTANKHKGKQYCCLGKKKG